MTTNDPEVRLETLLSDLIEELRRIREELSDIRHLLQEGLRDYDDNQAPPPRHLRPPC
jgi:hypothetical protein